MEKTRTAYHKLIGRQERLNTIAKHYEECHPKEADRWEKLCRVISHKVNMFRWYYLDEIAEKEKEAKIKCSFCGKLKDEVEKLISGPDDIYLCCECIEIAYMVCHGIADEMDLED